MKEKSCTKCFLVLPETLEFFESRGTGNKGFRAECRSCRKAARRAYRNSCPESALYDLLRWAKSRAQEKGLPFTITEKDVPIGKICPIFGTPLVFKGAKFQDTSPSIDRIQSTEGYVPGNVIVISVKANRIKNNGTSEEHRRIADWMDFFSKESPQCA